MIGHGVVQTVGEVRGNGDGGHWDLGVGLITMEDIGWTDRSG